MSRFMESPSFKATTHTPLFLVGASFFVTRCPLDHQTQAEFYGGLLRHLGDYKALHKACITLGKCRCLRRLRGGGRTYHSVHPEVRGQLLGVGFFLPLCRTWGTKLSSDSATSTLPTESSPWPSFIYFMHAVNTQHAYHLLEAHR